MPKPRALDLFCGIGGVAMGLHRAGFEVIGVDIAPQPQFPFEFIQTNAMDVDLRGFDFVWASPPCQAHSALRHLRLEKDYPCFIQATRQKLQGYGGPWIIENVPGAPLKNYVQLCGSSFGLRVRRHRWFESELFFLVPQCRHDLQGQPIDVSGTGGRRINRRQNDHGGNLNKPRSIREAREAIGIDWASRYGISQAIPPAYSEFLGRQILAHMKCLTTAQ